MPKKSKGTTYTRKAVTTEIKAESGISVEIQGKWYRFLYSETRILPEGANEVEERRMLWDDVHEEVDKQVQEIFDILRGNSR